MAFSFNFSGEDIDTAVEADSTEVRNNGTQNAGFSEMSNGSAEGVDRSTVTVPNIPVKKHDLQEWASRLFSIVIFSLSVRPIRLVLLPYPSFSLAQDRGQDYSFRS